MPEIEKDPSVNQSILERIQREVGVADLLDLLVERLTPTDLQSLLLEVYRRRASAVKPHQLLESYQKNPFVKPSSFSPQKVNQFETLLWSLLPPAYTGLELSPVAPLGTIAAIATVSQNKALATIRNTEVVSDLTNVLALEGASRRQQILKAANKSRERIKLAASHRLLRPQAQLAPGSYPHFRLFGMCVAGRDEGSFQFETDTLVEHLGFYLRLCQAAAAVGCAISHLRVDLTDLEDGRREPALTTAVIASLQADFPTVEYQFDRDREGGRGYYVEACFHIYAKNAAGTEFQLVDGGFTTWTQQLLNNSKERLLISGMGTERFASQFSVVPDDITG